MILIDSNIWIYYLDPTTEEHEQVKIKLEDTIKTEEVLTNTIIWMEVAHYLFKVSKLPKEKLEQRLKNMTRLSTMTVMSFDLDLYYEALAVLSEIWFHPIRGRDATILATMRKAGVERILTHDEGFKKLQEYGIIKVIDPILE